MIQAEKLKKITNENLKDETVILYNEIIAVAEKVAKSGSYNTGFKRSKIQDNCLNQLMGKLKSEGFTVRFEVINETNYLVIEW